MPVEKMEMVNITGCMDMLNSTLEAVTSSGCFHAESASEIIKSAGFTPVIDENPYTAKIHNMKELFSLFNMDFSDVKISFSGNADGDYSEKIEHICKSVGEHGINVDNFDKNTTSDGYILLLENIMHKINTKRTALADKLSSLKDTAEQLSHFKGMDFDISRALSSEFVHFRYGRIPTESLDKLRHYDDMDLFFVPCSYSGDYCWGLYLAPVEKIDAADTVFASLFFERLHLPPLSGTPDKAISETEKEIETVKAELKDIDCDINKIFSDNKEDFFSMYSDITSKSDIHEMRKLAVRHKDSFMLVGWVPKSSAAKFMSSISELKGITAEFNDSKQTRITPPTKLRNRFLFRPFQFFIEIFGVPSYSEIDPTVFLAITYTLLYGIMFADLGQGIVLALIGFYMYRFMKMPLGKILIPCGISGAIFGCVFGSVFGYEEILDSVYEAIGLDGKPVEVMSSATYLLAVSIGIGVLLVLIAMCLNIASSIKKRNYGEALFGANGVAGIAMYSSLILLIAQMFIDFTVNTALTVLLGIVLPAILIFMKEPLSCLISGIKFKPDSISDFILINFFELFEVILSYLTNTLSFLRVGAFILIHAGMMTAFSAIASLFGGGIPSILMMAFGNVFVIALEGLLVGIQVLRLEFYEMFSRYYDGSGKSYSPLKLHRSENN